MYGYDSAQPMAAGFRKWTRYDEIDSLQDILDMGPIKTTNSQKSTLAG